MGNHRQGPWQLPKDVLGYYNIGVLEAGSASAAGPNRPAGSELRRPHTEPCERDIASGIARVINELIYFAIPNSSIYSPAPIGVLHG